MLLLAAVMVVTAGRKPVRRLLLGLPIGTFLHLVFDGAWTDTTCSGGRSAGPAFGDAPLPSVARGAWSLLLEAIGVALSVWIWRRARLGDARGAAFWHQGRLDLAVRASPWRCGGLSLVEPPAC